MLNKKAGLYVHIPFCSRRCPYCDFVVIVQDSSLHYEYFKAVLSEVEEREELKDFTFDTLYVGGGTPSKFNYLSDLIEELLKALSFSTNPEITIEFNPEDLTDLKIQDLKHFKPRVSLGVQSLNLKVLNFLGRSHSRSDVVAGISQLTTNGFENISADLIYGVPGVKRDISEEVQVLVGLGVKHISTYLLTIEPGTHFYSSLKLKINKSQEKEWESICSVLQNFNFQHYEISNWAIKGYECNHNKKYWKHETVFGLGLGAVSFFKKNNSWTRVYNLSNLKDYLSSRVKQGASEVLDSISLEKEKQIFQLRTFKPFFPQKPRIQSKLQVLEEQNFLIKSDRGYKLTSKGVLSINDLVRLLVF